MSKQRGMENVDPTDISMCTECRHMVQTREMKIGFANGVNKYHCPDCYSAYQNDVVAPQKEYGSWHDEEDSDNLDPEMRKLKERLKKKGLM